jgi:UDP-3-O-[3-hydroxymyristoyl] glucosamine N-acyltransferase
MIQAQSGVYKSIKSNSSVMGSPAIKYIDFNKAYVYFRNLPSIMKSVQKLLKNNKDA